MAISSYDWGRTIVRTLGESNVIQARRTREKMLVDLVTDTHTQTTAERDGLLKRYRALVRQRTYPRLVRFPAHFQSLVGGVSLAPLIKPDQLDGPVSSQVHFYPLIPMRMHRCIYLITHIGNDEIEIEHASSLWAFMSGMTTCTSLTLGMSMPHYPEWVLSNVRPYKPGQSSWTAPVTWERFNA